MQVRRKGRPGQRLEGLNTQVGLAGCIKDLASASLGLFVLGLASYLWRRPSVYEEKKVRESWRSGQCDTMTLSIVISPYLFVVLAYSSDRCSQWLAIQGGVSQKECPILVVPVVQMQSVSPVGGVPSYPSVPHPCLTLGLRFCHPRLTVETVLSQQCCASSVGSLLLPTSLPP